MSRIGKLPIEVPAGVTITIDANEISVKGPKGELTVPLLSDVEVAQEGTQAKVSRKNDERVARAQHGLQRTLLNNAIIGVTKGFEKKLNLVGVGYRAKAEGTNLKLELGFSHDVNYPLPEGVKAETPTQTEIIIKGVDKQKVGQVAAEVRGYRPPEPYKGKGVRYSDEVIVLKETKKK